MITLSKALKIKNRLAGQLKTLQATAALHNSQEEGNTSSVNLDKVWLELEEAKTKLVAIKGKIGQATAPIAGVLAELSELKAELAFYETLHVVEGTRQSATGYGINQVVKTVTYVNRVNEAQKQEAKKNIQEKIEAIQDRIDEFNATTKIEF